MMRTGVIALLPVEVDPRATRVRLYTRSLSLVDEGLAGVRLTAPVGVSITATAYDYKGRIVAVSDPFETSAGADQNVSLSAMFLAGALGGDAPGRVFPPERLRSRESELELPQGGHVSPKYSSRIWRRQFAASQRPSSAFNFWCSMRF